MRTYFIRAALGVGGLKFLSIALALGTSVLLARGLGPNGYGQYAFVMALLTLCSLPIGRGLDSLLTREVAKYHLAKEWRLLLGLQSRARLWSLLFGTVLALVIAGYSFGKATWQTDDRATLLLIGCISLPIMGLCAQYSSILRGFRYVIHAQFPESLVRPGVHIVIIGCLLIAGVLNPVMAVASEIIAVVLALFLGIWILRRNRPFCANDVVPSYSDREWLGAAFPFWLLTLVATLNTEIAILLLGWLGSGSEVGAFRVAQSGSLLVALPLLIVNQVIAPDITRAFREGKFERLRQLSRTSARSAIAVSLPITLPMVLMGEPIIHFVFGDEYVEIATTPLAIMALGQLFNVSIGSVGLFLSMCGYERDTITGQIIALFGTTFVAVLLIPKYGAVGGAWAVSIGLVIWNILLSIFFVKRFRFWPTGF